VAASLLSSPFEAPAGCHRPPTHLQVILDTLEFSSAIRKTPVVVGNCTGFAVNRVFFPYTQVGGSAGCVWLGAQLG
jgi:hypothetical protein